MSEEQKSVLFNGDGDHQDASLPASQDAESVEQEQGTESEYLTRAEAQRLLDTVKEDVLRQTQSLTDKTASRIDKKLHDELKKIGDVIKLQRQSGIDITPEQERAMRQTAYDTVFSQLSESEPDHPAEQKTPSVPAGEDEKAIRAVAAAMNDLTDDIYKEVGVVVDKNDPEVELIDQSSPAEFLKSLRKAAEKKAQRIATPAEARITSLAKGSQTSLETKFAEEKSKIHGDVEALIQLKKKYRAKGLQID